jgi:hypothetical protein
MISWSSCPITNPQQLSTSNRHTVVLWDMTLFSAVDGYQRLNLRCHPEDGDGMDLRNVSTHTDSVTFPNFTINLNNFNHFNQPVDS